MLDRSRGGTRQRKGRVQDQQASDSNQGDAQKGDEEGEDEHLTPISRRRVIEQRVEGEGGGHHLRGVLVV